MSERQRFVENFFRRRTAGARGEVSKQREPAVGGLADAATSLNGAADELLREVPSVLAKGATDLGNGQRPPRAAQHTGYQSLDLRRHDRLWCARGSGREYVLLGKTPSCGQHGPRPRRDTVHLAKS